MNIIENGFVFEIKETSCVKIKRFLTYEKHIILSVDGNTFTITWQNWEGYLLDFEPTVIKVSGDIIEEQIFTIEEPTFSLEGISGKVVVEAFNDNVKDDKIEVVLP